MEKVDVLVVGAGPTGLTLATDLLRRGVRVKIIDKLVELDDKSKALGVQAGTLEALDSTLGKSVSQKMIRVGNPVYSGELHINHKAPVKLDFSVIESGYNYLLIIPQGATEKILTEELQSYGGFVERGMELKTLKDDGTEVICEFESLSGEISKVAAQYVVGCDGAHSSVRHLSGIQFQGEQYVGDFILGDLSVDWNLGYDQIQVFFSEKGAMAYFPIDRSGHCRMILIPQNRIEKEFKPDIDFSEFEENAKSLMPVQARLFNPVWLTRFRLHHRLAEKFSVGRVFLAGDAAHIHSPVGGQGMNIGMQDALNLSEKLKNEFRGFNQLEKYATERMEVAKGVVNGTDRAFRLGLLSESKMIEFLRQHFMAYVMNNKSFQHYMVQTVSEIKTARKEIAERESRTF